MAGAGFKTFATGDVLTASDVNTYLMQQTVMVFASSAARTTALGANVAEGMLSYLKDTDQVEVYNGSAWVASDDPNAIQNTIVDAKGDLITATANDTPARLAVGSDGSILVANSVASTGLGWAGGFLAGKNKIINGDFGIWQRGTSISLTTGTSVYFADRFYGACNFSAGTSSFSQQTFTAGTAPVAGYEGTYFGRLTCGSTSTGANMYQKVESVRTFAGQTITFSFWAKASTALTMTVYGVQVFGTGGSANVDLFGNTINVTTSWQRFTQTISVPSISGKTIGPNDNLTVGMYYTSGTLNSATIDTWGWQLEAGSVATPFTTATGTIQGELAAAMRYYQRIGGNNAYEIIGGGTAESTTQCQIICSLPVTMRTLPSSFDYSTLALQQAGSGTIRAITALTGDSVYGRINCTSINVNVASGLTAGNWYRMFTNNSTSGYLGISAEL